MPAEKRTRRREVALLIESSNAYARGLLQGIVHYVKEHQAWILHFQEQARGEDPPEWLQSWKGDGIIARIETPRIAQAVTKTGLPCIDLSAARLLPDLPWVETDDTEIAKLAVHHLMERGFRHFAFCGDARFNWSRWRGEMFRQELEKKGLHCIFYEPSVLPEGSAAQVEDLARWLSTLPRPIGLMACYDIRGRQVLEACRIAGISVPDDVAVVGVDNDELLCELCIPPLTSVIPNPLRTGYEAAALLDRLMAGRKVAASGHRVPPLGVAARQSSDVLAIDDRAIARATHFIRENACAGINVNDVLRVVPLSRRALEHRFKRLLGHTPHERILQVRLERVKQLLTETDQPLHVIAERTGFEHVEYLSVVFKREMKMRPTQYRRKTRG
jgi:LacI family transcriptional regulator